MLRKLEEKLKLDVKYFIKGGFWLGLSQFIFSIKNLILAIFLARLLSIENFGIYTYIISIFMFTNLFGAPGMGIAIMQSVARGFEGTYGYLTKKVFLWSLLGTAFLLFFSLYSKIYQNNISFILLFLLSLIFPFYSISTNFAYYLNGMKKFKLRMILESLVSLVSLLMIILAILLTKNVTIIVLAVIVSQTIANLVITFWLIKRSNNSVDYESYSYGKKMSLNYVIPTAKLQIDKILIANFLNYSSTAIYNVANAIGDQIYSLAKIAGSLIAPKTSNISMVDIRRNTKKSILILTAIFVFIAIVSFFLAPFVIRLFFGSKYPNAFLYAQVIILFIPIRCLGIILRSIHESKKNIRILNISSNYIPLLEIIMMFLGLLKFGIFGIIGAKIISDIFNLILQLLYIYKKEK